MEEMLKGFHEIVGWGFSLAGEYGAADLIEAGIFFAFAGLALLFAFGVVLFRNVVHSALSLTATFICVACLYISVGAHFMGAVELLVYGGAVAVLIVMAVMLTRRENMASSNPSRGIARHICAAFVAGAFLLAMGAVTILSPFESEPNGLGDAAPMIADLMLTRYVLPVEAAAVLLLVAMIGAIILAKGADPS